MRLFIFLLIALLPFSSFAQPALKHYSFPCKKNEWVVIIPVEIPTPVINQNIAKDKNDHNYCPISFDTFDDAKVVLVHSGREWEKYKDAPGVMEIGGERYMDRFIRRKTHFNIE